MRPAPPRLPLHAAPAAAGVGAAVVLTLLVGTLVAQPAGPDGSAASAAARSQARAVAFRHLGPDDGLPGATVRAVSQDALGFVWVGTTAGLGRYDGYAVVEHRRSRDSTSLPDDGVTALAPGAGGAMWVGTRAGLAEYRPETESFRRLPASGAGGLPSADVLAVVADSAAGVWVGTTGGLAHLADPAAGRFESYRHAPADSSSLPADEVGALLVAADGALWVGTAAGVARRDPATGRFRRVALAAADGRLGASVSALAESDRGTLWVATLGDGLFELDPATGASARVPLGGSVSSSVVSSVYQDDAGVLWVGTRGAGLHRVEPGSEAAPVVFVADDAQASSLADNIVSSVFEDRQGVLWVGTYGGLDRTDRARSRSARLRHARGDARTIGSDDVRALLAPTGEWMLAVGTDRGLSVSRDGASFEQVDAEGPVEALADGGEGAVWVGTPGGLGRLRGGRVERVDVGGPPPQVQALLADGEGVWVGTRSAGLLRVGGARDGARVRARDGLASDDVRALARDADGRLWAGTADGLCRLDGDARPSCLPVGDGRAGGLADGVVRALLPLPDGTLWVGTRGGLHRLDTRAPGADVRHYGAATTDLPSDDVLGLAADARGDLWAVTARGLARFDPITEAFQQRPLESEGVSRSLGGAAARAADGTLYFGGTAGVVAFAPDQLAAQNPRPPQVAITSVRVAGRPLAPAADGPLRAAAPVAERLALTYDQDYVTFVFAGLHYADPARNRYRVRMDGFDETWRDAGRSRTATYTNLDPGRYTFRVQAANADGVWSETGAAMAVTVSPPWWRTLWAYVAYAGLLIAGLIGVDRLQRRRLLRKERERAEKRESEIRAETAEAQARKAAAEREAAEAEARAARAEAEGKAEIERAYAELQAAQDRLVQSEKLASLGQLTAGIAHEIKNPLNFVNNFADLSVELADELADELAEAGDRPVSAVAPGLAPLLDDLRENARRIHEHGTRADRIVKAMLLHSRGGAGEKARVDANRYVEEYANLAYHGARANDREFQVELVRALGDDVGEVLLVPQEMGRVLINLLSNAFYAVGLKARSAGAGYEPRVTVSTSREGGAVQIAIADNGPGIPEEVLEKVFEPFFTTKPTGEGTGLGLSLSYDIVVGGHGGTLDAESVPGEGTTFRIGLPPV